MNTTARIGASIHIKGEVTSHEPLAIAGRVEGTIEVDGHSLVADPGSNIKATVTAHTIVVAGQVSGSLMAGERIEICETATIEGELSAPAISLAEGATVHGRIETIGRTPGLQLAS
jgi:cytoskeletal protein CcmA (bactofilin family)